MATTPPQGWGAILHRNVPHFERLSRVDRTELLGKMQVFLAEKKFEGCKGFEVTEEVRVTIAAQACVLLLHRETDFFPDLETILVYPQAYVAPSRRVGPDGVVIEGPEARQGESWSHGVVVLSWHDVRHGAADINDGHNLVFHEFAHQLDSEYGDGDGAPALPRRSMYIAWARVLGQEFAELTEDVAQHRRSLIDAYGATNPAEFFAVVTEVFFEKPRQLRRQHPALYAQLQAFYLQDPAALPGATTSAEGEVDQPA